MAELKTKRNKESVSDFLANIKDEKKREDCLMLAKIFEQETGYKAEMWGKSIVGFGSYHYKSERSSQEGDWMLTGFAPRVQAITLYIMPGFNKYDSLLKKLGKHKVSSGCCLYIKKLEDVDENILREIIKESVIDMKKSHMA